MNIYKIEKEYLIRTYECDRNENLRLLTLMNIFRTLPTAMPQRWDWGWNIV